MYCFFPTKSFRRCLINNKMSDNFWNLVVSKFVCFSAVQFQLTAESASQLINGCHLTGSDAHHIVIVFY